MSAHSHLRPSPGLAGATASVRRPSVSRLLTRIGCCTVAAALYGAAASAGVRLPGHPVLLTGRSALGRAIRVVIRGNPKALHRILVVGCIHGDECAGTAIAGWLEHARPEPNTRLWIVENLNPDGYAARSRVNGRGVDLNRNFPWHWHAAGRPGDPRYPGDHPLSEPESRFAARLIERIRPQISIWFHQHLGVVDDSGGSLILERRLARLVALPLVRLPRYPGSATSWQNHLYPNTSVVVELRSGTLTRAQAARYGDAVLDVLGPT